MNDPSIYGNISIDDPTYQKHLAVLEACINAGVSQLPKETAEYFGDTYPSMEITFDKLHVKLPFEEYSNDFGGGYKLKVADIPDGVEIIYFSFY